MTGDTTALLKLTDTPEGRLAVVTICGWCGKPRVSVEREAELVKGNVNLGRCLCV